MKYKFTILNSATYAYLIGCLIYSLWNYQILSSNEGWGIVYMVGLFVLGLTALIVDLVIQNLFKRNQDQKIANGIALFIYVALFFIGK